MYAMNNLATCYAKGNGVAKSIPAVMYWLKKAGESGNQKAIDNYNQLYDLGYRAEAPDSTSNQK